MLPATTASSAEPQAAMQVVASVDLNRYAGKWYEIARLPNRFQRDCASDTSATYELRSDGKVSVINACRASDGRMKTAKGTARRAGDKEPNTKLRVTFFWPFYGNYWIIDLDPDYRWAVVGEPDRKYLWVLSREPQMEDGLYQEILERAKRQGYNVTPMIRTKQS
jgi:apolipoprotein D and lipocalin family protein